MEKKSKKVLEIPGEIKQVSINSIKPYWRNPRKNDDAVPVVKRSIERHGYLVPIIVDNAQSMTIVTGHTRYRGLVQLGYDEIPVLIPYNMTEQQAKEFRIEDNASAEHSDWDIVALTAESREIKDIDRINEQFKNIDLEKILADSVGVTNFKEVSKEQVNKETAKMENQFQKMGETANTKLVVVTCPHCAEDFHINRDELL